MSVVKPLDIRIPSQTDQLHLVREFISREAMVAGFDEEATSKIALAVDEACTNVIKHSYEFAPNYFLDIRVQVGNGKFEIVIRHSGKSFDPSAVKSPNMREYMSQYRRGGLGMHLMRSLMDTVEYKTTRDELQEVHLVKLLPINVAR